MSRTPLIEAQVEMLHCKAFQVRYAPSCEVSWAGDIQGRLSGKSAAGLGYGGYPASTTLVPGAAACSSSGPPSGRSVPTGRRPASCCGGTSPRRRLSRPRSRMPSAGSNTWK